MKKTLRSEFVSRQNMLQENYEIYYYDDTHFQNVSLHTHDYYEFYFPAAGEISMEIRSTSTRLSHRDVAVVPPRTRHRAVTSDPEKSYCRYVFWISRSCYQTFCEIAKRECYLISQAAGNSRYIFHFSENEYTLIQTRLLRLLEEDRSRRFGSEAFSILSVYDLLLTMDRIVYERDHPEAVSEQNDLFQQIHDYIETHLEEDLSLKTLQERFFVSTYHIVHLFKDRIGVTPHQYILRKRLDRCASLIALGKPIIEAAEDCGFDDYSVFYRAFKKEYQLSPKEYQTVHLLDPMRYAFPSQ